MKDKDREYHNQDKFNSIMFAVDYIMGIQGIQGGLTKDDIITSLTRLYEEGFADGKRFVLDELIYKMYEEIDKATKDIN